MTVKLTELPLHVEENAIPQEYKDASIIQLYKWKGNSHVLENYRDISLVYIARTILVKSYLIAKLFILMRHDRKSVWAKKRPRKISHDLYSNALTKGCQDKMWTNSTTQSVVMSFVK